MTQFNLKSIATIFAAVLLLGATENARANLITFDFKATLFTDFGFGTSLTGSYTFDSNTSDSMPLNPVRGIYGGAIVAMDFDIALGPLSASSTAPATIAVHMGTTEYQVTPAVLMSGNTISNTTLISFEVTLFGVPLLSDALPTSPPGYSKSTATLGFMQNRLGVLSFGTIDSISIGTTTTTVPEPATLLLLGLTLLAVAPKVRRRPHGVGASRRSTQLREAVQP